MALMNAHFSVPRLLTNQRADVMKSSPHNINLHRAWPPVELHISAPHTPTPTAFILLSDLLSSHPSRCNSSHVSWWGAGPAHQSAVGTQKTPCDRGNLQKVVSENFMLCKYLWRSVIIQRWPSDRKKINSATFFFFQSTYTSRPGLQYLSLCIRFKQLLHLACRSVGHRAAWIHVFEHEARLHPAALSQDLHSPPEPQIPRLWTGIH